MGCVGHSMQMRSFLLGLFAGLMLAVPAWAQQWFVVSGPGDRAGGTVVEIDLETVRIRSQGGEGVIRVTLEVPQAHSGGFGYRSFVASVQLDCARRSLTLTSAAYYPLPAGQGQRVGADSSGRESGMPPELLERIPAAARQAILRATCTPTQN